MTLQRTPRPGEQARVPFEQAISLRFKYFGEFIEELSANISIGGMFVRTRNPHPVGSIFEFEFRLGDDFTLIEGKAQVVWVRRRGEDNGLASGMGVRFVELEDHSRQVIQRMVHEHPKRGGAPFELPEEPLPAPAAEETVGDPPPVRDASPTAPLELPADSDGDEGAPVKPEPTEPAADHDAGRGARTVGIDVGVPRAQGARRRWWVLLPWALAAAAVLLLLIVLGRPQSAQQPVRSAPAPDTSAAELAVAAPATSAPARSGDAAPPPASEGSPEEDAKQAVRAWSLAWSEQRVDDYLAVYSEDFRPPDGLGRQAWERRRRARILAAEWIKTGMAFVETEVTGPDRVLVRFVQAYESDAFRDVVRKRIELRLEGDDWRIVSESLER